MHLSNTVNHRIIKIDVIDPRQNLIVYSIYEKTDGILLEERTITPQENLKTKLTETTNFEELAYQIIATTELNYEIATEEQNWKLADRAIRLTFPSKLINESLLSKDALSVLISTKIDENANAPEPFIFYDVYSVIAYFSQVLPEDNEIIAPYIQTGEVIFETKNI
jgi:hypothetical protein